MNLDRFETHLKDRIERYKKRYKNPRIVALKLVYYILSNLFKSLPEVVGDAGIKVNYDSDEEHIAAYEKYYYNNELRLENIRKGLERAKLFSWQKCTDVIVNQMFNAVSKE